MEHVKNNHQKNDGMHNVDDVTLLLWRRPITDWFAPSLLVHGQF